MDGIHVKVGQHYRPRNSSESERFILLALDNETFSEWQTISPFFDTTKVWMKKVIFIRMYLSTFLWFPMKNNLLSWSDPFDAQRFSIGRANENVFSHFTYEIWAQHVGVGVGEADVGTADAHKWCSNLYKDGVAVGEEGEAPPSSHLDIFSLNPNRRGKVLDQGAANMRSKSIPISKSQ